MAKKYLITYFIVLVSYGLLDYVWLGLIAKDSYVDAMGHLMRDGDFPKWPWVAFYMMYAFAIVHLVIMPRIDGQWFEVAFTGAVLGIAAYGAYNLTNYAILKDWPVGISIKDWIWGTSAAVMGSLIGWSGLKLLG